MSKIIESLTLDGNTLPIQFIRYNPHSYSIDGVKQRTNQTQRHEQLIQAIHTTLFTCPFSVLYIYNYMFYDTINNRPAIFNNTEYNESFKQLVT